MKESFGSLKPIVYLSLMRAGLKYAKLLNEIALNIKEIAEENGIIGIFPYPMKERPRFYASLYIMASRAFSETQYRSNEYSFWRLTEPKDRDITTYPDGVEGHQWESWGEVILFNGDIDQANQFLESFKSLVDSDVYLSRIKTVIENTERWEKERRIFGDSLRQEVEKIRLGDKMEGKCSICKQCGIFSR